MSAEFNTLKIYSKLDEEIKDFIDEKANYGLLSFPKVEDGDNYQKVFAECLVNELVSLTQNMSKNSKGYKFGQHPADVINENDIPLEMMHQFREVAGILQYMINCYSWRSEQGYKSFDAAEIRHRLERAAAMSYIATQER